MLTRSQHMLIKSIGFVLVLCALSSPAWAVVVPAPELDPGSMASALGVLGGGLLILTDRVRRR